MSAASQSGTVDEFTGFAWLREKKINQKIGPLKIRTDIFTLLMINNKMPLFYFLNFRGTMDQRAGEDAHNW